MIYLFEDRKGRMDQYLEKELDFNHIKVALIDCKKEDLYEYLNKHFSDSKVVLFHSSYLFNDTTITNEDIKKYFKDKKVPFVYFSGGLSNSLIIENGITNANVNSGDMYKNLNHFIKKYNSNNKVNIPILVYGEKYLLNSLLELQTVIGLYLFEISNNQILNNNELYEIIDLVDARLKEEELQEDKMKLRKWLDEEIVKQKLTKKTLVSQIQKLNDKY